MTRSIPLASSSKIKIAPSRCHLEGAILVHRSDLCTRRGGSRTSSFWASTPFVLLDEFDAMVHTLQIIRAQH